MRVSLYKYVKEASMRRFIYSDQDPIRIVNKNDKIETELLRHAIISRMVYDGAQGRIGLWKDLIKTGRRLQQVVGEHDPNTLEMRRCCSCDAFMRFVFQ